MSRTVSAEPRLPATVENRRNTGVSLLGEFKKEAPVMFDQSAYEVKTPCAPAPLAWTAMVKLVLGLQLDVIGHTPLWHPFMVEMRDFLAEDEIF